MRDPLSVYSSLSDEELLARVEALADRERNVTAELIASLAEVDVRRLYLAEGFSSLYDYCTRHLGLSEYGAYRRIEAARVGRRLPAVLDALGAGEITLTTINLLAKEFTEANHRQLLAEARHASRREVELIVARLHPSRPARASVRRLAALRPVVIAPEEPAGRHGALWEKDESSDSAEGPGTSFSGSTVPDTPAPQKTASDASMSTASALTAVDAVDQGERWRQMSVTSDDGESQGSTGPRRFDNPASAGAKTTGGVVPGECYRLHVTLSREAHDRLRRLRDLLRHSVPDGNLDAIVERAITHLLAQIEKKRLARTSRPRPSKRSVRTGSRRIPAAVQRAVWERDGARCAFVGRHGRCTSRAFLELHHVVPFAAGGKATVDNIQLRCRAHNAHEAEVYFGKRHRKEAGR